MINSQKPDITVIDTETTGLDPRWHEVIDIYAVRVDGDTLEIQAEGGALVIPYHLDRASADALEVNHFDPIRWAREGKRWPEVWEIISELLKGAVPCGHVVHFDLGMIAGMLARYEMAPSSYELAKHWPIDTCQLSHRLKQKGLIKNKRLETVAAHFGIENPAPHTAQGEALTTLEVLRCLTGVGKVASRGGMSDDGVATS